MSRNNTANYESVKASQLLFQNPDRSFPTPGAVLAIDNLKGSTTWSRNLDIKSLTLSGTSSIGILTYENQLLVNGVPVGGGGGVGSGYNITVAGGTVNMDVKHDISMNRNSIQDCSSLTFVAQFGTPGTFRSIGTDILLNKPFMVASSPIARLTLKGNTADQSSLTFAEGTKTLTMVSPQYEFKTTGFGGNIIAIDASSQLYVNVPAGTYANVLGYDVATGAVRYQPASGGGADVSGGSNISVVQNSEKQVVSLAVREDIDMSANSIINCKSIELPRYPNTSSAKITFGNMSDGKYGKITYEDYDRKLLLSSDTNIELRCNGAFAVRDTGIFMETPTTISAVVKGSTDNSNVSSVVVNNQNTLVIGATDISGTPPTLSMIDNTGSGSIRYVNPNIQMSKSMQLLTQNPQIVLQDSTVNRAGAVSFAGGSETLNMSAKYVSMISNAVGSVTIDSFGKTTSITNARIADTIFSSSGELVSSTILTPDNKLTIGSIDISTNPVLRFQGGKASNYLLDTSASIEYFDASGIEQLRFTSKNYALNAVPSASPVLPTVLGYNTATGEIKAQPATNGMSVLTDYTYNEGGALDVSGMATLGTFTPSATGIYGINFIITIENNASTPIVFNNTQDAFELVVGPNGGLLFPPLKITSIQNRIASSSVPEKGIYSISIYQLLTGSTPYTILAGHENVSGTCRWAYCFAEVRIAKLC